jgi:hypothetical protein
MQKGMEFEAGEIRAPNQCGDVVDANVSDRSAAFVARNICCRYPLGRMVSASFSKKAVSRTLSGKRFIVITFYELKRTKLDVSLFSNVQEGFVL